MLYVDLAIEQFGKRLASITAVKGPESINFTDRDQRVYQYTMPPQRPTCLPVHHATTDLAAGFPSHSFTDKKNPALFQDHHEKFSRTFSEPTDV